MGILSKIKNYVCDKDYRFLINADRGHYDHWDDERYLKRKFKAILGRELDLENPKTFNEKLQWLKLHDRKPVYSVIVDKYRVRDYIREKLGEEYLIPLIGAWDSPDEIDFDALPEKFVLKCNHNSGVGMYICKDKSQMDVNKVKEELRKGLTQDYYLVHREWPYKDVPRKIICEQFLTEGPGDEGLTDYKFHCFNGVVDRVLVCMDRASGNTKFYNFDRNWKMRRQNRWEKSMPADCTLPKPQRLEEMFQIAEKLSAGFPYLRVDLYYSHGNVYFGELTLFPASGFDVDKPKEDDMAMGEKVDLSRVNKE